MSNTLHEIQRRQSFIERAAQQRGRFDDAVIDRVIEGHAQAIDALRQRAQAEADQHAAEVRAARQALDTLLERSLRIQIGEHPPEPGLDSALSAARGRCVALDRAVALIQDADEITLPEPAPAPEPRRAVLFCEEGSAAERVYPLNGHPIRIGRGRGNELQLRGDSMVSRAHGELIEEDGRYFYTDLASANGSQINGDEISGSRRLLGGEEIVVGATVLRFRIL